MLHCVPHADQKADAEKRVDAHWLEVKRKQDLAKQLRAQLRVAELRRDDLGTRKYSALQRQPYDYTAWSTYEKLQSEHNKACLECAKLKEDLKAAETAPAPVIQPLPESKHAGFVWVFHMHMPEAFRRLSRAAFLAQQLLLPNPQHAKSLDISAPRFKCHLVDHYNQKQQPSSYLEAPKRHLGAPGCVQLHSCSSLPLDRIGPAHVDDFHER